MIPLFDKDPELVGWISDRFDHIFDTDMNWVAYISNGHAWSAKTGNWCGPVNGFTCLDQAGKVVAWTPTQSPKGTAGAVKPVRAVRPASPVRPATPVRPARPVKPAAPVGGWSALKFSDWASQ
jgi:hypothetical protein